jgi:DcmR-like sensory protein/STAS domain-containing protein
MPFAESCAAVRPGEHACCRFAHAGDRRRIAAAFVSEALTRGHKIIYLCDRDPEALVAELAADDDRVEAAIERGQFDVRPARGAYAPQGRFDVERMLLTARDERDRALAEGYPALSFTGEMGWADASLPGFERLAEYERRFAELMERADLVALCQYDAGGPLGPATLSDVAAAHEVDLSPELATLSRTGTLWGARINEGRVLRLTGDLDFDCADALAAVLDAHFHGPLYLDLADLAFVDVTGMRALRGHKGQRLTISGASAPVHRMLQMLAWDTDPDVEVLAA